MHSPNQLKQKEMNAKAELARWIERIHEHTGENVICWSIWTETEEYILKRGYSQEDFEHELNRLDFNYDDGYGCQELFGTVLFSGGSWLERDEYDGSENWAWKTTPTLPECD